MKNSTEGNNKKQPSRSRCGRGRRKVEMKKIENKNSRIVTFSKRKRGLFKKARDITAIFEREAAVITFSPGGKAYEEGEEYMERVVLKYIEQRKGMEKEKEERRGWWRSSIEGMKKEELKEFKDALIVFKANLEARLQDSKARDKQTRNFLDDLQPS